MNTTLRSFLVTSFTLLASTTFAADFDAQKLAAIPNDAVKPFIDKNEISGAVTCVVTPAGVPHLAAIGQSDVATHRSMQPDDLFWIASMTKPITGVSIMILQEEGKLSVDDPVSKFIPEFANIKTPSGKPANLTIKHLMSHTSGLAENTGDQTKAAKTLADLIPGFVTKPTGFEPGAQWRYCQTGINSLGRIIEVASGQSYPDFVTKRILQPLGMKDTTFYPTLEQQKRIAHSYEKDKTTGELKDIGVRLFAGKPLEDHDRVPLANGGLYSTAPDYARFCQMLLNEGTLNGKTTLKPESVRQMRTPVTGDIKAGFVPGSAWALTVGIVKEPQGITAMLSPGTFGHGGAYGTQAWIDPAKGVAYVLMIQRSNFPNQGGSDGSPIRQAFQQSAAAAMK